jgi:hypothetical protein
MTKQKIHTPGLYLKDDFVKVIPTTEQLNTLPRNSTFVDKNFNK